VLSGKQVEKVTHQMSRAGAVRLTVSPAGALARDLAQRGTARAKVKIAFAPVGGASLVKQLRMRLVQRSRPLR
jgi:hypothetical protein